MIIDANNGSEAISQHDMNWSDVRIAFLSGLVRSYLGFLLSFDYYPLRVLNPFKVIAKASRTSGILNTLYAPEMLTTKTSHISHVLLFKGGFARF